MAKQHNWVGESVTGTPGTGTITLGGASYGHIQFEDAFTTGDTVHYAIVDGANREIGIGTLTTGTPWTLARTTVLETLVAGTYDDTSPVAITLTSGALVSVNAINDMPGTIVGSAITTFTTYLNVTATLPADNSKPQNTEGTEVMTVSYTPKYANSILRVYVLVQATCSNSSVSSISLFRDSTADAIQASREYETNAYNSNKSLYSEEPANATTSTTFKVRTGSHNAASVQVNGDGAAGLMFDGVSNTFIKVEEIRQ